MNIKKKPDMVNVVLKGLTIGIILGPTIYFSLAILLAIVDPSITRVMYSIVVSEQDGVSLWGFFKIIFLVTIIACYITYGKEHDKLNIK